MNELVLAGLLGGVGGLIRELLKPKAEKYGLKVRRERVQPFTLPCRSKLRKK